MRSLFLSQLKTMSAQYNIMCGCECCISSKIIHSSLLSWRDRYLKNSRIKVKMLKVEVLVRNHITYMKHIKIQWCHMGVIFMSKHLKWKMLQCAHILSMNMHFHTVNVYCGDVMNVHISIFLAKKQIKKHEETTPSIRFHIYHIIGRCNSHGRLPLKDKEICYMCRQESSPDKSTKIYTRK